MRACLGSCLVLGYRVWAARLGIPLTNVEVDVTCEFDTRGQLGLDDDVAVGWERIVFDVRIESDAPSRRGRAPRRSRESLEPDARKPRELHHPRSPPDGRETHAVLPESEDPDPPPIRTS